MNPHKPTRSSSAKTTWSARRASSCGRCTPAGTATGFSP